MATRAGQVNPQLPNFKALLKEGYLLKRQRGQSSGTDLRGLKFQQRFICLTQDFLNYYVDKKVCCFCSYLIKATSVLRHCDYTHDCCWAEGREKGRISCNSNEDH